ncbi:GerW family sporulation protein [Paenibacillus dokdonensis]|uniref:GerW family sporulation protein n=1 Tax=Paenibacillus dokdonensis TaxID=2567944 RepID=A0ABU6GUG2_9BACL|nr:GerW family sporulation protein [Paenibacillus dokdonensis]MEC0243376.1 GerW family sporulation protein [Paenibacillus dokdonensis]
MTDHPIQGLMQTAMENIKGMVDVNTIVGDPVQTPDGSVILPISKVGFGFAAGGSDFNGEYAGKDVNTNGQNHTDLKSSMPFGGGSGGGVSIRPIAFLVVGKEGVHIVPLDNQTHLFEKLIDSAPMMVEKIQSMFQTNPSAVAGVNTTQTPVEQPNPTFY